MSKSDYKVILFYKFVAVSDPAALRNRQQELCHGLDLLGRILIGQEGINGTLEGKAKNILAYQEALRSDERFADIVFKSSPGTGEAFTKLEVKIRPEIVALGTGPLDQSQTAPTITAEELNQLYKTDEDFVVLDLRNDYEIAAGAFERTVDPGLGNFRDLPAKLDKLASELKDKKVITVCTGGIRCEKATCLMKNYNFKEVRQLKDGIHTYMEKFPGQHFQGTLYVFDNRMVTDVVDIPNKVVIGRCHFCGVSSEQFYSDDSQRPSKKVIACDTCYQANKNKLRVAVA